MVEASVTHDDRCLSIQVPDTEALETTRELLKNGIYDDAYQFLYPKMSQMYLPHEAVMVSLIGAMDDSGTLKQAFVDELTVHKIAELSSSADSKLCGSSDQLQEAERLAQGFMLLGVSHHAMKELHRALKSFLQSLFIFLNLEGENGVRDIVLLDRSVALLYGNLGRTLWDLKRYEQSLDFNNEAVRAFKKYQTNHEEEEEIPFDVRLLNNLALSYHKLGKEDAAVETFKEAIQLDPGFNRGELFYNMGISLRNAGKRKEAEASYLKSLDLNPTSVGSLLNLATLYHEHLLMDQAIRYYDQVLSLPFKKRSMKPTLMALNNLAIAMIDTGNASLAISRSREVLEICTPHESGTCEIYRRNALVNIMLAKVSVCNFTDYFRDLDLLIAAVMEEEIKKGATPSHLPFDTLLLKTTKAYRHQVAVLHALQFTKQSEQQAVPQEHRSQTISSKIKVGYMSYDWGNHPTAHLAISLLKYRDKKTFETHVFDLGVEDASTYRTQVKQTADKYHNLFDLSHDSVYNLIKQHEKVDILFDMQLFTRGNRFPVVARRPAEVVVNYLVYPGTSGSTAIDYLYADKHVLPGEDSKFYTEKIVYFPDSYQVNYYAEVAKEGADPVESKVCPSELQEAMDVKGISAQRSFVFCNFNKNDKIDPDSFGLWMDILGQQNDSVLWLLEPSREFSKLAVATNLRREATKHGVDPDRLVFAKRLSKAEHLERQQFCDLFLDTVVYGAHSTFTDALKAKLPIVTLGVGEYFTNRVGLSLLNAVSPTVATIFAVPSYSEYVSFAVGLSRNPVLYEAVRSVLHQALTQNPPLFDANRYLRNFERAAKVVLELKDLTTVTGNSSSQTFHVLL